VLPERPAEHVVLLGDQRDVAAQVVQRQLDQRHAAVRADEPVVHREPVPGPREVGVPPRTPMSGVPGSFSGNGFTNEGYAAGRRDFDWFFTDRGHLRTVRIVRPDTPGGCNPPRVPAKV